MAMCLTPAKLISRAAIVKLNYHGNNNIGFFEYIQPKLPEGRRFLSDRLNIAKAIY